MFELLDFLNIPLSSVILYIIMFICAWLLLRDIKCWYWKVHELIRNQEAQLEVMDAMLLELRKLNYTQKTNQTHIQAPPKESAAETNKSTP